ncbi:MAG: hypothetical protein AAFX46_13755 [Cyanobacteria bacterium J06636_27]
MGFLDFWRKAAQLRTLNKCEVIRNQAIRSITQQDDNTLIAANNSELAILQGVGADSLMADNFAFG